MNWTGFDCVWPNLTTFVCNRKAAGDFLRRQFFNLESNRMKRSIQNCCLGRWCFCHTKIFDLFPSYCFRVMKSFSHPIIYKELGLLVVAFSWVCEFGGDGLFLFLVFCFCFFVVRGCFSISGHCILLDRIGW